MNMDIHIVVEKPEYMILSERAAALELQIGHYCARLVRASLQEQQAIDEYKDQLKELSARNVELSDALEAATKRDTGDKDTE